MPTTHAISTIYITTTIPYVNARPHLGHALELVQADVLARHHRRRGDQVRFQTGTDDNSLKNVLAAEGAGVAVQEFVDRNAAAFAALRGPLSLSADDVIRTSSDPRHRPGVERLWQACYDAGDLYRKHYEGLYCIGCEQFYQPAELIAGRCPEHGTEPQQVAEENWFFRLSRYAGQLHELISSGRLAIEPPQRRNEVLGFIASGLADFSVSRSTARAHGWGIPVPGDPTQVIYVWWDALGNYVTALDFGTGGENYGRWWAGADQRVHLVGKGVLRFHAVYWPAILLSAGLPPPTAIGVHGYLTVDGRKISKSSGATVDPAALATEFGADAVRWWLLRELPRVGDADFTVGRLIARSNDELANGLGNLVNRVVAMTHRYRGGYVPVTRDSRPAALEAVCARAPRLIDTALAQFDFRRATGALCAVADEANRYVNHIRPWELAKAQRDGRAGAGQRLDAALATLIGVCGLLAEQLAPFLPDAAARIARQCTRVAERLPSPSPVAPKIPTPGGGSAGPGNGRDRRTAREPNERAGAVSLAWPR